MDPANIPQPMYDSLSPSQQQSVREKLASWLQKQPNPCPSFFGTQGTPDLTHVGPDTLVDRAHFADSVYCFQLDKQVGDTVPGELDEPTYNALMGWWGALPTWEKVAIVALGVAAAIAGARGLRKHKRAA